MLTDRPVATGAPLQRTTPRHGGNHAMELLALAVFLLVSVLAGLALGAYSVPLGEVLGTIGRQLGFVPGNAADPLAESVLWEIRFPRVALAVVVGASLGCAGAVMQGTFGNPLAEPGVVGVSSGAVVGAVASISLGVGLLGTWSVPIAAFVGGLVTVAGVYLAARSDGRTEVVTLVLTGIAVNAFAGALIGLMTFFSDDAALRAITSWTLGSLAQATWVKVGLVLPLAFAGTVVALLRARSLDLLALGERSARHLGVDVEQLRIQMMVVVAALTAAAVAVAGVILFVGLVIPHLARMAGGPSHRWVLLASILGGAGILVLADLLARTLVAPAEIPLGVFTALIGSPFFLWQLRRTRAGQGGWA